MSQSAGVLGIDFGTCNCCMAMIENGVPYVIPNAEGARITPSVIALTKDGRWLVGEPAKRQAVLNPINTVFSVKRLIGRKYTEISETAKWLPYEVSKAVNGDARIKIGSRLYPPSELAALILRKMKMDAEAYIGSKVNQAIITVPSYFDDIQRQATKDAASIAGLEVIRIINESTAACTAYGLEHKSEEIAAVVHFGGGTFDVSILGFGDGVLEVKATNGNTLLGGDDIDQRIMDWLVARFKEENGIDLSKDAMVLQRLREAAEKAKCDLTYMSTVNINLPFIAATHSGPAHLNANMTREMLECLATPILSRLADPVLNCLRDGGISAVDHVVLAGSMTRMPLVQRKIEELFGRRPYKGVHPDEVVAMGAAILGGVMKGEIKDVLLLDVSPLSLGIETQGGMMRILIDRNTTVPTRRSEIFSTAADNQDSVEIHVLQGERKMVSDNKSIGKFHLNEIALAPRGVPQIEVAFDLDNNGILKISAKDLGTGKAQKISLDAWSWLDNSEFRKAISTCEDFSNDYLVRHPPIKTEDSGSKKVSGAEPSPGYPHKATQ